MSGLHSPRGFRILGFTMKRTIHRRRFLKQAGSFALALPPALSAADAPAPVGAAAPTLVRTRELMAHEPNPGTTTSHVWRLHQSATSRTNLVEMAGEAGEHIHPDAEHSLSSRKRALQDSEIKLLHLQHGLERPLRLCRVGVGEQLRQDLGNHLPRDTELVL